MGFAPRKADIFKLLEIAATAKPSKQPYTESCVVTWRQALRSVDREIAGSNKRIISPEIFVVEIADCLARTGRQQGFDR